MVTTTVPKLVKENLARAKAYLTRDETIRSLEAAIIALKEYENITIVGNNKFVTEVGIQEYVADVNRHSDIRNFFISRRITKEPFVVYKPGQENLLAERLDSILNGMSNAQEQFEEEEKNRLHEERQGLLKRGLELLYTKGDEAKGRAVLRRYLEMYGKEQGVITQIADHFLKAKLPFEAASLYEQAMNNFSTDPKAYVGAISAYTELGEHEKTEKTYLTIIKTFGAHPKTFLNFAKFYLSWNKKDKAYDYALRAFQADNNLAEAKSIMDKIDKRI